MTGGQRLAEYGNQYHRDFTRSITEPSSEKHEEKISNMISYIASTRVKFFRFLKLTSAEYDNMFLGGSMVL